MELKIESANAIRAHRNGGKEVKATLEQIFGDAIFKTHITERIKSVVDALDALGLSVEDVTPFKSPKTHRQHVANVRAQLDVIAEALQDGFVADYSDRTQQKWYVWFEWKSGVGFVVGAADCVSAYTCTDVGSRHSFPDAKTARYFAEQFIDLHRIVLTHEKFLSK